MSNPFTTHPKSVGETYLEHAGVALWLAGQCVLAGLIALTHAVFPFFYERGASGRIAALNEFITNRTKK